VSARLSADFLSGYRFKILLTAYIQTECEYFLGLQEPTVSNVHSLQQPTISNVHSLQQPTVSNVHS
jgi:hypothetical protein